MEEALAVSGRFLVGFVLLVAALPKLGALDAFVRVASDYAIVPRRIATRVFRPMPVVEFLCGLCLVVGFAVRPAAIAAATLLIAFCAAVSINLLRGRRMDCGCGGSLAPRQISWTLVVADFTLASLAVLAATVSPSVLSLDAALGFGRSGSRKASDAIALAIAAGAVTSLQQLATSHQALRDGLRVAHHRLHATP
jgi:uncharacterized membrane protein YphA (DoxX/SURF4 family)